MRTVPSTNPDELNLTVPEARAMDGEEFFRLFGFATLDDVPLVAPGVPGCLDRAPSDCNWYVRFRPAPKNPGAKARKRDSYELVVKRPKPKDDSEETDHD